MHTDRHLHKTYMKLMKQIQDNDGVPCASLPEMFFPQGQDMEMLLLEIRVAKNICSECPVKAACLEYAVTANEPYGIFGGTTPAERNLLRRRK